MWGKDVEPSTHTAAKSCKGNEVKSVNAMLAVLLSLAWHTIDCIKERKYYMME